MSGCSGDDRLGPIARRTAAKLQLIEVLAQDVRDLLRRLEAVIRALVHQSINERGQPFGDVRVELADRVGRAVTNPPHDREW
jgi:hypothetical protein